MAVVLASTIVTLVGTHDRRGPMWGASSSSGSCSASVVVCGSFSVRYVFVRGEILVTEG